VLALLASAGAGVLKVEVWPRPDDPRLDQPGSPGVVRNGSRLEFTGPVPWSARHASGRRAGRRVSFGTAPPAETPEPASWEHYAPDMVTLHGPENGTISLSPEQFEFRARLGYFTTMIVAHFLIVGVFFFTLSVLLRFKGVTLPAFGPLRLLGRCVIPASAFSAIVAYLGGPPLIELAIGAFVAVMGMNAILFVLGARPAVEPAPFEV
jgi:hypothetical protein